jgi:hypothetical protein
MNQIDPTRYKRATKRNLQLQLNTKQFYMFLIKEKRKRSIFCVDIIGNTI